MEKSEITKKAQNKARLYRILSIVITVLPLLIYTIIGFVNGEVTQKLALGCSIVISGMLVIVNVIFKKHIRSTIWIMLLGIYMCLNKITTLLLILAITTILDEFVLTPLANKYSNEFKINKEIDKRQ